MCVSKLADADPRLKEAFFALRIKKPDVHISWAFRGEQDQNDSFKRGASRLQWPDSKHNKKPAQAMDLFQIRQSDGLACWQVEYFTECADTLRPMGIKCGLDWVKFRDPPHFEI